MKRKAAEPPGWWNLGLYGFVHAEMPLAGWCWEFQRRHVLKYLLGKRRTVDAMNPKPRLKYIRPEYRDMYLPWNHSRWSEKRPALLPSAVSFPEAEDRRLKNQPYRIGDKELRREVQITVDMNRRDSVIERDFKELLQELRKEHPPPRRIVPRPRDWSQNRILEAWDLKQFDLYWKRIQEILGLNSVQSARNAYNTAERLIAEDWVWPDPQKLVQVLG